MDDDIIINQPLVIDNGSGSIKAGFAGDDEPKCIFSNCIGFPKYARAMFCALEGDYFIGSKCQEHRGILNINYPMEHGIVTHWDNMEKIWAFIYEKQQLATSSEEHPVLLTEAPNNSYKNREKCAEIFFETFNIPALYVSMQAVLSLYSTGKTTGVVLDSGDGVTHAVPIYQGYALNHCTKRSNVGGRDVTFYLKNLLELEGLQFNSAAELEITRDIKEKCCYLTRDGVKDEFNMNDQIKYTLPDGNSVYISSCRSKAGEVLFRPSIIGQSYKGIHDVLHYSIVNADLDIRNTLYENIVLSGGSTLFKGFGDRLMTEIRKQCTREKIKVIAPRERLYSTWIGGSVLASLDTFKKLWVTKKEFEAEGIRSLYRKQL